MPSYCFLQDRTSIIVGVKAELGAPGPMTPNAGRIQFFVDWYVGLFLDGVGCHFVMTFYHYVVSSALASPEFEGREGEDLGQHLAHKLVETYQNSAALDLPSLSVIPGQQCWVLYVDALVRE